MSLWSYISGTIIVSAGGRSSEHSRFIIDTTLKHLPIVRGSEGDMVPIEVIPLSPSSYCNVNEYCELQEVPACEDNDYRRRGMFKRVSEYCIVLKSNLRDTTYEDAYRQFIRWIYRLSSRVTILDILIQISGDSYSSDGGYHIFNRDNILRSLYDNFNPENPYREYLFWDLAKDSYYPKSIHEYKYGKED